MAIQLQPPRVSDGPNPAELSGILEALERIGRKLEQLPAQDEPQAPRRRVPAWVTVLAGLLGLAYTAGQQVAASAASAADRETAAAVDRLGARLDAVDARSAATATELARIGVQIDVMAARVGELAARPVTPVRRR